MSAFAASGPAARPTSARTAVSFGAIVEMDRDRPAAAAIVGRHHGLRRVEDFRQLIEQGAGGVCCAGFEPGDDRWT